MPQDNVLSLNAFGEIIEPKGKRQYPNKPQEPREPQALVPPNILPLQRVEPVEAPEDPSPKDNEFNRDSRGSKQANQIASKILMWTIQTKLLHWQTVSQAEHKYLDKLFGDLVDLGDELVESVMGKYGRPDLNEDELKFTLTNYKNPESPDGLPEFIQGIDHCFRNECCSLFPEGKDPEIHNLIQEILGKIDKVSYLLTLRK
jgi:hypothetical protein